MYMLKLDANGDYQTIPPTTDAEIVALGAAFYDFESGQPDADQICPVLLKQIGGVLGLARDALGVAAQQAVKTREAATALHTAMLEATPLLDRAIVLLMRKYETNLSVLGEWGLKTKTGARDKVLVTRPKTEAQWAAFMIKLVEKENGLPAADRLGEIPLARLTQLAASAAQNRTGRSQAANVREQNVAARSEAAKTLYDLLLVGGGLLVVTRLNGRVTTQLQDWGFNVQPRKVTLPPTTDASTTDAANLG